MSLEIKQEYLIYKTTTPDPLPYVLWLECELIKAQRVVQELQASEKHFAEMLIENAMNEETHPIETLWDGLDSEDES